MPAFYKGHKFDTTLEAQWAAFFDIAGWDWRYKPVYPYAWKPDFWVSFTCRHSECDGSHALVISVLPIDELNGMRGHPAFEHQYGEGLHASPEADAGSVFGNNPKATEWDMCHGCGGGTYDVAHWVRNAQHLWAQTFHMVEIECHNEQDAFEQAQIVCERFSK